jgi:AraC family transcriptional regulator
MHPQIKTITSKKLIGQNLDMSIANNKTFELWREFMPRRKEIINSVSSDLVSIQVYDSGFDFNKFDPNAQFQKWAAMEVHNFDSVPEEMETYTLPGGLYATFSYKGLSSDTTIFETIYGTWIPNSEYELDHRPHFEILGEKYKNNDPSSEEEIWIPIKLENK